MVEEHKINKKGVSVMNGVFWASCGTGFAFLMTTLGAATVFFFRRKISDTLQRVFMGFAAGVMIAASVWSLLLPAIEDAKGQGGLGWTAASGGFIIGVVFLIVLDKKVSMLYKMNVHAQDNGSRQTTLLITAVMIHNIPEGMAVGLAFALAAQFQNDTMLYASAMALAIGIGVQNFPEGAAISLPLKQEGFTAKKAFVCGSMSGIVEPLFGIGAVLLAQNIKPYMPWLLSFAAGAMMYVVAKELIPASASEDNDKGTVGVMVGFLVMMILDVALG